jgi:type I restriction enzyme S subunit
MIPLGEVLTKSEEWIGIDPAERYKEITVRLWGKGVVLRRELSGAEIRAERRIRVRAGQFIMSRIDARNGALGIVPDSLDGAVVTNDFPVFKPNPSKLVPAFIGWMSKTRNFVDFCRSASEGTTNRVRLKEERFLTGPIPLPPLEEQWRIAGKIEELAEKIEQAKRLREMIETGVETLLRSTLHRIIDGAPSRKMQDVAPLVRRHVVIRMGEEYPELGIRSFGKGTFHKPALDYLTVGTKKLYRIEPGDVVFNNVFAWEGAIAVSQPKDVGRFGSHRFITCVAKEGMATANFLCFYFLTPEGLEKIAESSPGGAGRNRTLGLEKLARIEVPIPTYDKQLWFGLLHDKIRGILVGLQETGEEFERLLPAILDRAFKGEL